MPQRVTKDMNEQPNQKFMEKEIVVGLKQMNPTKAPGPDGLLVVVFQKYWKAVNE